MNQIKTLLFKVIRPALSIITSKSIGRTSNYILISGIASISTLFFWEHKHNGGNFPLTFHNSITRLLNDHHTEQFSKNNFMIDVTKKCSPSVVAIELVESNKQNPDRAEPIILSNGSGFVIDSNGWILANAHSVLKSPGSSLRILTTKGDSYNAEIKDINLELDLALLKTNCKNLPAMKLGNSKDVLRGEWVVALGCPLSMKHTITAGVVSSVERNASELGMKSNSMKYLQTDAAITFGHSGGPLVNLDGEVIGVNNLRITAGIAFAIPIDYVKEFIKRSSLYSKENEQVQNSMKYPKFGISTIPITAENIKNLAEDFGTFIPENTTGILVWNVLQNSPASKAGLTPGDIITQVNRKTIKNITHFYKLLRFYENKTVIFTIHRGELITDSRLEVKDK